MNKIFDFVKKHDILFVIIISIIILIGSSLNRTIEITDELWNFNNIYKMYNGAVIYNDSNVIQTPLFFYIGFIIFKIFGANFLIFRIYNIIIFSNLITLIYVLFKTLQISKIKSLFYTILASILLTKLLPAGANYNVVAFAFSILGIILIIKNNNKPIILYNIWQGAIIFLVFISKQNIGMYYMIGLILSELLTNESKKNAIIKLIKEFFTSGILLLGFLTYLYFNNNLYGFIDYAFLGITEFANGNLKYETIAIVGFIITIIFGFIVYFVLKKLISDKLEEVAIKNINILYCFSMTMIFIAFPIFNKYHILLALGIFLIEIIYIFHEILIKEILEDDSNIIKGSILISIIISILYSSTNFILWNINIKNQEINYKNPYFGGILTKEQQKNIKIIDNYIKSNKKDVIIGSSHAALYMIPIAKNNGVFDLLFLGNLGKDGEDGIIKKISQMQNTQILLPNEYERIQESEKIEQYIKENLKLVGNIQEFNIYETK